MSGHLTLVKVIRSSRICQELGLGHSREGDCFLEEAVGCSGFVRRYVLEYFVFYPRISQLLAVPYVRFYGL